MSIRDYSYVPDSLCPAWVVKSRECKRQIAEKERQILADKIDKFLDDINRENGLWS